MGALAPPHSVTTLAGCLRSARSLARPVRDSCVRRRAWSRGFSEGGTMVRHVDALDPLPDAKIKELDAAYLETHKIDEMFEEILQLLLQHKPLDHMQFVIDCLTYDNKDDAIQDPVLGMSRYRLGKLEQVFDYIDKDVDGKVRYSDVQTFMSRFGGQVLTQDELKEIFKDFDSSSDGLVVKPEFYKFFSKISQKQRNSEFNQMIEDM